MGPFHRSPSSSATPTIVSVGQTTIDTVHIDHEPPRTCVGGSAYIPARILAESGVRVGLVCCLGEDIELSQVQAENLDVRGVMSVPGRSTAVVLHYSGQNLVGLRVSAGASRELRLSQVPPDYFRAKLLYLSPAPLPFLLEFSEVASSHGVPIAFSPKEDFPSIQEKQMRKLIALCTFVFVNERELPLVTALENERTSFDALHQLGPEIVVVTRGRKGVSISSRNNGIFEMAPSRVVHTRNPIGAGDCFAAMFLSSTISGHSINESAREAISYTERWLTNRNNSSFGSQNDE